ncbi:T-cell surface antigen CD2-like isoform X3 [Denticeps clupeoides]|uniref:T-cell surface antigen CD2-like isoform X2 n=1 Tax=Denticeps clupeoides TaxID=299321 RepID=UPI0010A30FEF|nr:T-cell surface antigen CD2 isoform X2 [Denticeps clupeoides]XP_028811363.1 T-cell surface antigen CD2 isoform X3 [Denticeps clupeoides]
MGFSGVVILLLLCGCSMVAPEGAESCVYKEVGDSYTIVLSGKKINTSVEIEWKRGDEVIYKKKKESIVDNNINYSVDDYGSLTIKKLELGNDYVYKGELFNKDGQQLKENKTNVCVKPKCPVPTIEYNCSSMSVILTCVVRPAKDLTFQWFKDSEDKKHKENTLTLKTVKEKDKGKYSCSVSNGARNRNSSNISIDSNTCIEANPGLTIPSELFGFSFWPMVAILSGGGFLVLLLLIVLTVSCIKSHRRKKQWPKDIQELTLADLNYNTTSRARDQRGKSSALGQPVPLVPDERNFYQNPEGDEPPPPASRPKARTRPRPPPPPEDDEEAPPLPQPRKKAPRTPRS